MLPESRLDYSSIGCTFLVSLLSSLFLASQIQDGYGIVFDFADCFATADGPATYRIDTTEWLCAGLDEIDVFGK